MLFADEAAAQSQIAILHCCYLNAMACTKLITAIINRTGQALVLKVGAQNRFAKLATAKVGGEHKVEIDVNWTYQEFLLETATTGATITKVIVNSDDCCDFERITVTESEGKLRVEKLILVNASLNGLGCNKNSLYCKTTD